MSKQWDSNLTGLTKFSHYFKQCALLFFHTVCLATTRLYRVYLYKSFVYFHTYIYRMWCVMYVSTVSYYKVRSFLALYTMYPDIFLIRSIGLSDLLSVLWTIYIWGRRMDYWAMLGWAGLAGTYIYIALMDGRIESLHGLLDTAWLGWLVLTCI